MINSTVRQSSHRLLYQRVCGNSQERKVALKTKAGSELNKSMTPHCVTQFLETKESQPERTDPLKPPSCRPMFGGDLVAILLLH